MYCADTVGKVKAVDLMEALLLRKTAHRIATIKTWRSLAPPVVQSEVTRFEGIFAVRNQTLSDFFSILKEGPVHNGFAAKLVSNELLEEFAFASILTTHEKWYKCLFTLDSKHKDDFDKVCQRIVGDLFVMFKTSLFAPKTTNRAKYFLHVLHYLQGCNDGPKLTARIQDMPLPALRDRGGLLILYKSSPKYSWDG
jgi:hypothetical protein